MDHLQQSISVLAIAVFAELLKGSFDQVLKENFSPVAYVDHKDGPIFRYCIGYKTCDNSSLELNHQIRKYVEQESRKIQLNFASCSLQ